MDTYTNGVGLIVLLLGGALLIGIIAARLRIPYAVALLAVSLPFHYSAARVFEPSLLIVFLPALVFEGAWQLDLEVLRRFWRPIAFLALPGVAITALTVAFGLWLAHLMPFLEALLLGAIVSTTDPIAVISTFRELNVPRDLATIVEGESLCNDGIAAVLYGAILAVIASGHAQVGTVAAGAAMGLAGGAALGLVSAGALAFVARWTREVPLQIVATLVATYAAYLAANRLGASGIFAALVVGVSLRAFRGFPASAEASQEIDRFWDVLAFISNALVFLLLGLRIEFNRIFHEPILLVLTLGLVVASRLALTYFGLPLLGIRHVGWRRVVMLAGMRGALSLALALALPDDIPFRSQIVDAVIGVVVATLLVQGLALRPVLQRLNLGARSGTS